MTRVANYEIIILCRIQTSAPSVANFTELQLL